MKFWALYVIATLIVYVFQLKEFPKKHPRID
jgi:hypothetical protein